MEARVGRSTWDRLAPWVGVAFAVLFIGAFIGAGSTPDNDDKEAWVDWYSDSGNRWQSIIATFVLVISTFGFLWFTRSLITRFASRLGLRDTVASIAEGGSTLFVAFTAAGAIAATATAAGIEIGEAAFPDSADLPIMLEQLGFGLMLVGGGLAAGVTIACIAVLARRLNAWPSWLVWFSFVVAALQLAAAMFIPFALVPLWALVTGLYLGLKDADA